MDLVLKEIWRLWQVSRVSVVRKDSDILCGDRMDSGLEDVEVRREIHYFNSQRIDRSLNRDMMKAPEKSGFI